MTEVAEVADFKERLNEILNDLTYEINTVPGEDDNVKALLQVCIFNINNAIGNLILVERKISELTNVPNNPVICESCQIVRSGKFRYCPNCGSENIDS